MLCIPLKTKQASEVVQAYIDNAKFAKFGGSVKILSDNGTEFKNQLFEQVAIELGVRYKNYTAPYRPSSNGHIEGFHNFLKTCISKHISSQLEWTSVVPSAVQPIISYPMTILRNPLSFLCLEGIQFFLLTNYFPLNFDIWGMISTCCH